MNLETLAFISLILAAIPCGLFFLNLFAYRPPACSKTKLIHAVSVLIPARNEERNIHATLAAVSANQNCDFEVIVLDDHSTDLTAQIVREFAKNDSRIRLERAPTLPDGWCGKQHACHVLARLARHPLLIFMDADVRLTSDALARLTNYMEQNDTALASGVPRQESCTFLERLLIPLIHFILLGFLPMHAMRRTFWIPFSAGCGQLFIAQRDAYEKSGGHRKLRNSLHDGIKLPSVFRQARFRTDLFDATQIATCRMYHTNAETWRGFGKNASEGLAAPAVIFPMTALLLLGQVFPFAMLFVAVPSSPSFLCAALAAFLALLPRLFAAKRFQQSWLGALLHPFGITFLLAIQWQAFLRKLLNQPMQWKGRNYMHSTNKSKFGAVCVALAVTSATLLSTTESRAEPRTTNSNSTKLVCPSLELEDQFGTNHSVKFPRAFPTLLIVADRKGSEQIDAWVAAFKKTYAEKIALIGVADVGGVPGPLQNMIRKKFRNKFSHIILLDWSKTIPKTLHCEADVANVFLVDPAGNVLLSEHGECQRASLQKMMEATDLVLNSESK